MLVTTHFSTCLSHEYFKVLDAMVIVYYVIILIKNIRDSVKLSYKVEAGNYSAKGFFFKIMTTFTEDYIKKADYACILIRYKTCESHGE